MKRGPWLRQDARKPASAPRKAALPKLGRKGALWAATRNRLKVRFAAAGITRCEHCGTDNNLGFAHRLKRRNITTQAELETVALICNEFHDQIEALPEAAMGAMVNLIIDARETPV